MSICGTTLTIALAALWVVFTPPQAVPLTMPVTSPILPHLPAAHIALWSESQRPAGIALCVPEALANTRLTEEHSSGTIDLRVPEALLEHLYGAGRLSGLEKGPAPWAGPLSGEISITLDWSRPGYAPARPCPGQRWPTAEPLPVPAGDQYGPRK
jgi:hypothetical protein